MIHNTYSFLRLETEKQFICKKYYKSELFQFVLLNIINYYIMIHVSGFKIIYN